MPNIKLLSAIGAKIYPMIKLHVFTFNLTFDLEGWPWLFTPQNVRGDVTHMYAKYQEVTFNLTFDLEGWPWPWHLTPQNVRVDVTHMYAKYHVVTFNLTFDLEGWPWPWHVTHQSERLNEMNTHAKYQVAICNRWKVMTNVKAAFILPLCLNDPHPMIGEMSRSRSSFKIKGQIEVWEQL